ncbi:MAG: hypothetical protein K0R27_5131, partial [Xanthobacteraceae bacterium]|nr:hypothetical protein [Xanthobacteraceae bacterium]
MIREAGRVIDVVKNGNDSLALVADQAPEQIQ